MIEEIRESAYSNNGHHWDGFPSLIKRNSYKTSFPLIVFACDKTRLNLQVLSRQNEMCQKWKKILFSDAILLIRLINFRNRSIANTNLIANNFYYR